MSNAVKDYGNQIEKVIDSKMKITYVHADISIEADKGRITQVICNLLSNAEKFTTEGSIMISTERKSSQIVISVKDTALVYILKYYQNYFQNLLQNQRQGVLD